MLLSSAFLISDDEKEAAMADAALSRFLQERRPPTKKVCVAFLQKNNISDLDWKKPKWFIWSLVQQAMKGV